LDVIATASIHFSANRISIVLHEFGHLIVYRLAGVPVHVSLQSVRPTGAVNPSLDRWAKFTGLGLSWLAAVTFLVIAKRRPGFGWPVLKSCAVYVLSLTVGIAVVILDELVSRKLANRTEPATVHFSGNAVFR
jgi:hypothetical protein